MEQEAPNCENIPSAPLILGTTKKKRKVSGKRKREEFILESQDQVIKQGQDGQVSVKEEPVLPPEVVVPKLEGMGPGVENAECEEDQGFVGDMAIAHNSFGDTLECPFCPKVFTHGWALRRHAATHEKKRYKCEICEKLMSRKDNLLAHQRAVHGYVPETKASVTEDTADGDGSSQPSE